MSYSRQDLLLERIQYEESTIGGGTYYISEKPTCFAMTTSDGNEGGLCTLSAGTQTDHKGTGRCWLHSGNAGRPPVTGRYATIAKNKLKRAYEDFYNDPDLLDLTAELALQRSLLAELISQGNDQDTLVNGFKMLNDITKTVERVHRIQNQNVLTVAAARLLMLNAVKLIEKYLPEEDLEVFLSEWRKTVEPVTGKLISGDNLS